MKENIKTYTYTARRSLNEVVLRQGELTLGQKQDLLLVLSDFGIETDSTDPLKTFLKTNLGELLKLLKKNRAVLKFLRVILIDTDEVPDEDLEDMTYETEKAIFSDFFLYNATLFSDLSRLFAPSASSPSRSEKGGRSGFAKLFTKFAAATSPGNSRPKK